MAKFIAVVATLMGAAMAAVLAADLAPPPWAYPVAPPASTTAPPSATDEDALKRVPNSNITFTPPQLRNPYAAPDWHPDEHPSMPEVVARGRDPGVFACAFCHLPNGQGRPENSALAGLPATYIVQQMADFKSGARRSAEPRMRPPALMLAVAASATANEISEAAAYFSSLEFKSWIKVIETDSVPATLVSGPMLVPAPTGEMEPIGNRIIELPEDLERTELRDSQSGFIAYVPKGSIAVGKSLVSTGGNGKTLPCTVCHGPDLKGLGPVPPLAGRSPSYVVRQLYDFQNGVRAGLWSPLMADVVAKLSLDDMVAIAAYTASQTP